MSSTRVTLSTPVPEKSTRVYSTTLTSLAGTAVPLVNITSIKATLFDRETGDLINSRDAQDVKNTNGGSMHATSGLFELILSSDDNVIVDPTNVRAHSLEWHVLMLEIVFSDGTEYHEVEFPVENLARVS